MSAKSAKVRIRPDELHSPRFGRVLLALVLSLVLNLVGIQWGLPNDNNTWAADSLQPLTPMAVGKHVLMGDSRNSGWFYFKYPLGHPTVLLMAQSPYLAWAHFRGELKSPSSTYPYGFKDPERSLAILAVLTRLVSALMGVGVTAVAIVLGWRLFGVVAGELSGFLVAGFYPLVFYSHTANVDVALLFWCVLAILAVVGAAEGDSRLSAAIAGVAAAMALLTKEQAVGLLAALPFVWLIWRWNFGKPLFRGWRGQTFSAVICAVIVTVVVGNVWWNPAGYWNRWRFLLGILPAELREKYAPYQFLVQVPKGLSLEREGRHILKAFGVALQALTPPVAVLASLGVVVALLRRRGALLLLFTVVAAYYALSLRALELLPVRYVMPLSFFALLLAAATVQEIVQWTVRIPFVGALAQAVVIVLAILPGLEVDHLLLRDPRYAAEEWLRAHARAGQRIEVYQPQTYLPRFASDLRVTKVPEAERRIDAFAKRRPEFVVLSGGGKAGLTGHYAKDWKPGDAIFSDSDAAKQFMLGLRGETLGYHRVVQMQTPLYWIKPRINSLNPEINIYVSKES